MGPVVPDMRKKGPRRVLLITGEYPPRIGGVGDHVVKLRSALESLGLACEVATESRINDSPRESVRALNIQFPFQALIGVVRMLRQIRPDILHIQFQAGAFARPGELLAVVYLAHLASLVGRVVVTFHDLNEPYLFPKAGRIRSFVLQQLERVADSVIYVDELDRRWADVNRKVEVDRYWIPAGPTIEPTGRFTDRDSSRSHLNLSNKEFIVGYFGFWQASKGVRILAEAMRRPELKDPSATLALIGAPGPTVIGPRSEVLVEDSIFRGLNIIETGAQDPAMISMWLNACDVIALPFLEGLSSRRGSFMNAVAHGIPVVTTEPDGDGVVDVADHEVAFVPPGDVEALAQELAALRDDEARRDRLAAGSYSVAKRHSWSEIARRTQEVYDL